MYNTIYLLTNKLIITNMNGKFSTLMAGLLLASAFTTVEAGVVKVTTPVTGKQYVIGESKDMTNAGGFAAATMVSECK